MHIRHMQSVNSRQGLSMECRAITPNLVVRVKGADREAPNQRVRIAIVQCNQANLSRVAIRTRISNCWLFFVLTGIPPALLGNGVPPPAYRYKSYTSHDVGGEARFMQWPLCPQLRSGVCVR
jgi:hypothetical protein